MMNCPLHNNICFYKPDIEVAKKHAADNMYSYLRTRRWGYLIMTAAINVNVPSDNNNAKVIQSSKNNSHPLKRDTSIMNLYIYVYILCVIAIKTETINITNLVIAILV